MSFIERFRPTPVDRLGRAVAADLNAASPDLAQLSTARRILAQLARHLRWDHTARQTALRADMALPEVEARAIDARLTALRKWEDIHDPDRRSDQRDLMTAATLAPLVDTDHGLGFDDATFGELVGLAGSVGVPA